MPTEKRKARNFRFTNSTNKRLTELARLLEKTDTQIIEEAVAHLLGTLERDQPVWLTSPPKGRTRPNRGNDAA